MKSINIVGQLKNTVMFAEGFAKIIAPEVDVLVPHEFSKYHFLHRTYIGPTSDLQYEPTNIKNKQNKTHVKF